MACCASTIFLVPSLKPLSIWIYKLALVWVNFLSKKSLHQNRWLWKFRRTWRSTVFRKNWSFCRKGWTVEPPPFLLPDPWERVFFPTRNVGEIVNFVDPRDVSTVEFEAILCFVPISKCHFLITVFHHCSNEVNIQGAVACDVQRRFLHLNSLSLAE